MPRFTTRRLMLIVALVAGAFGATEGLRRRSQALRSRSLYHKGEGMGTADELTPFPERWRHVTPFRPWLEPAPLTAEEDQVISAWRQSNKRRLAYHVAMYQKYEQAAARPWLPIAPDPPEPK